MKQKIVCLLLAMVLLVCAMPLGAVADAAPAPGDTLTAPEGSAADYPAFEMGRIEAEDMDLGTYFYTVDSDVASGGKYIKMYADRAQRGGDIWARSSFVYDGRTGQFNIDIVYPDFYSGSSTRKLYVNGEQVSMWAGRITYGLSQWGTKPAYERDVVRTKTVRDVILRKGDIIQIETKTDYGEYGELDYVEIYQGEREAEDTTVVFPDMEGRPEQEAVHALAQAGIINGTDGLYRPNDAMTTGAFVKMLVLLMGYAPAAADGYWAQPYLDKALLMGWVTADDIAAPDGELNGAAAAAILGRIPEAQQAGFAGATADGTLTRGAAAQLLYELKQSLDTLLSSGTDAAQTYPLDSMGYIKNWLYTGMVVTDIYEGTADANAALSLTQSIPLEVTVPDNNHFSVELDNGMEFRPYAMGKSGILNDLLRGGEPEFGFALGYLCADLIAESDVTVSAKLIKARGYDEVYLNGQKVASLYTNWTRNAETSFTMNLKKGVNRIFVRLQGLNGNIITITSAIRLLTNTDKVRVAMPALGDVAAEVYGAEDWAYSLDLDEEGNLVSQTPPPAGAQVLCDNVVYQWPKYGTKFDFDKEMAGKRPTSLSVKAKAGENYIDRALELVQNYELKRTSFETLEQHQENYRQTLIEAGGKDWDWIQLMLLKLSEGMELTKDDNDKIMDALASIDQMNDCAEFAMVHAQRIFLLYPDKLEQRVLDKMKDTILNFGYWSDEEGTSAMVMTSENHKIGFYTSQYLAGRMYPNEVFTRSGRTGAEQEQIARTRLEGWLSKVEEEGFEEYNSSSYVDITFNALLNLYDFADDPALEARAKTLLDLILHIAAATSFDGVSMGTEARVYAEKLYYPATSEKSMILSYLSPKMNVAQYSQQVMGLATSDYRAPADLDDVLTQDLDMTFRQGGSEVTIRRTGDYIISSSAVPSPVTDTLSFNFQPGTLMYQYHIWEAAVSAETKVFTTHPGAAAEGSTQRPGYWYGEYYAPVIKQTGNTVMEIYNIPEDNAIQFTHAYFTEERFEETVIEDQWLFGRVGEGYIGLWCSRPLERYSDMTIGREFRANGLKTAWVCQASNAEESGSFEEFMQAFKARSPVFDENKLRLNLDGENVLKWQ